jgi:hypothetical protein
MLQRAASTVIQAAAYLTAIILLRHVAPDLSIKQDMLLAGAAIGTPHVRRTPDARHHRRAITDAIGLVLLRCAEENTTFWAWLPSDWLRLIGAGVEEFERPWPGWIDGTVRPYVAAYAAVGLLSAAGSRGRPR